jgi:hypothetical protein
MSMSSVPWITSVLAWSMNQTVVHVPLDCQDVMVIGESQAGVS